MSAFPVAESQLASPELALVDPALAAELRRGLRPSEDTWHRHRARVEEIPATIEASVPEQPIAPDAPDGSEPDAEHFQEDDDVLEFVEETVAEEASAATAVSAPHQPDFADSPVETLDTEHLRDDDDYIVGVVEESEMRSQQASSHYPVLPAPEPDDANATDAALREIRARLVEEVPASERRLRRRFTIASGASAVCALAILAVDLQLKLADVPSLPGF